MEDDDSIETLMSVFIDSCSNAKRGFCSEFIVPYLKVHEHNNFM